MNIHDNHVFNIKHILSRYFSDSMINQGAYVKSGELKELINNFTCGSFDWVHKASLFANLRNSFPEFLFEDQTHFYQNDRCLKIYATKKQGNTYFRYGFKVSIFSYFSADYLPYKLTNGNYILDCINFIDYAEDDFCDEIFNIFSRYYDKLVWLDKIILKTPIRNLNIFKDISDNIIIHEPLFTEFL